jgi:uncharacterized repeat protein (TIGR01451 family)/MYXO-CTERM domain-containing protein
MVSRGIGRMTRLSRLGLLPALLLGAQLGSAQAAPQKLAEFNENGSFMIIGNTVGHDCGPTIPAPTVGTVGNCGTNTDDSAADVLWDADTNTADVSVLPSKAGSTAVLNLPAGAIVVHARLFWAAQLPLGSSPSERVVFDRPDGAGGTVFATAITGDPTFRGLTSNVGGRTYYQGNADVTKLLQRHGSGTYRVRQISTVPLAGLVENVAYVNWHLAVVYRKADEPTRNIVLYRSLDAVHTGQTASATLDGFLVPNAGFQGLLGVVGYEGDTDLTGDSLSFNGAVQSNALNPATNFFNATRSNLGQAITVAGDKPQATGQPGSLVGLDIDVVDVTAQLTAGAKSATVQATSSGDLYFLGSFATAISTLFPVFSDTTKTYVNVSRPGFPVIPGDTVRYTIRVVNNGSDASISTVVSDSLPPELLYVPGSLRITEGPNAGNKTDQTGDDQAEYDPTTRTLTIRIGTGATATAGGRVPVGEVTTIEFLAQVSRGVSGTLNNQAIINAQGERAVAQAVGRAGLWLSGDGTAPSVPTSVTVNCLNDLQCPALAPKCDRALSPPRCACVTSADCPAGLVCDTSGSRRCVQCTSEPAQTSACAASGLGSQCLVDNTCGCNSNEDCGGRTCDLGSRKCPHPTSDLDVRVIPPAMSAMPGSTALYSVQITNIGPDAVNGASILTRLPPGAMGVTWTCMAVTSGAMCPAQSGSGALPPTVTLPGGGRIVYTVSIPVGADYAGESLPVEVTAVPPSGSVDPQPGNNVGYGDSNIERTNKPDLKLTVQGQPAGSWTTEYTANVSNNGTAPAGGAYFSYTAPEGAEIIAGNTSGEGWDCQISSDKRVLNCDYKLGIPPQGSAPPVTFLVRSPQPADPNQATVDQPFTATVTPHDPNGFVSTDANPADNTFTGTFQVSRTQLVGGGFGCDVSTTGRGSAPLGGMLGLLFTAAALGLRRRQKALSRAGR